MKRGMTAWGIAIVAGLSWGIPFAASADDMPQTWIGPEHIWRSTCGYCHGLGAPELRGAGLPPPLIMQFARRGAPGMPPFHESEITDIDLRRLAEWIAAQPKPQRRP
jgi:mono/diheme cytochrome c family protein